MKIYCINLYNEITIRLLEEYVFDTYHGKIMRIIKKIIFFFFLELVKKIFFFLNFEILEIFFFFFEF
jgi:hypothetical protein